MSWVCLCFMPNCCILKYCSVYCIVMHLSLVFTLFGRPISFRLYTSLVSANTLIYYQVKPYTEALHSDWENTSATRPAPTNMTKWERWTCHSQEKGHNTHRLSMSPRGRWLYVHKSTTSNSVTWLQRLHLCASPVPILMHFCQRYPLRFI